MDSETEGTVKVVGRVYWQKTLLYKNVKFTQSENVDSVPGYSHSRAFNIQFPHKSKVTWKPPFHDFI